MTLGELNQLHRLKGFIAQEQERLEDLRATLELKSPILSDMPKTPGAKDKLGETMPKIVDEEQLIQQNIETCCELRNKLITFIYNIEDLKIRQIFILRFIEDMSWNDVADRIGGRETESSVKNAVYRYVERQKIENPDF